MCGGYSSADIGQAFACTISAGLATLLGTIVLWIAPLQNPLFVSAALSFAAGVLTFVSFVDIFAGKSVGHFSDEGWSDAMAFAVATACFFGGWPIAYILDLGANYFMPNSLKLAAEESIKKHVAVAESALVVQAEEGCVKVICGPNEVDPSADDFLSKGSTDLPAGHLHSEVRKDFSHMPRKDLLKMGVLAAVVIAAHNLPEGLVTFMAYMDDISNGVTVAVAIAIHNIPEGIVVALPLYYATDSKLWAVSLSALSAFTEPLGALIGLAVACTGSMNDIAFGVVFGLVGGIMVYISLKELLPMARRLDPNDRVSTLSLVFGMMVIASSLIAIGYTAE